MPRKLHQIAVEAFKDMGNHVGVVQKKFPAAWPYLDAMATLETVEDKFYCDSGKSIVLYFLANAGTWKGETARRIKAELKELVK